MKIKIVHTSDLHGYFFPTDYLDRERKAIGYLSLLNNIKKDEFTILTDGGDTLQGSSFAYYVKEFMNSEILADMMQNVDYYTLGNHDFNYGYDYLKNYTKNMRGKLLCANVIDKSGEINLANYAIKEIKGFKIGIVGIVTDWVNLWERKENLENFEIKDSFETAKEALNKLKEEKTDFNILIYHGGYEIDLKTGEKLSDTNENVGGKIAKKLDYDLILAGHQHMELSGKIDNTFAIETPANGTKAAVIEIDTEDKKISASFIKPKLEENYLIKKYESIEEKVQDYLDMPIAKLSRDYLPEDKIKMATEGSALADLINKIQREYTSSDISITSFANVVSGLKKNLTTRDVLNTYRFPNTAIVLEIDGKTLRKALEQNYTYIEYDGEYKIAKRFLEPKEEHYNFDFFYGISFELNLKKESGNKIGKIYFKEREIKDEDKFSIVMNNYRATGAGGFDMYKKLKVLKNYDKEISEILLTYFRNL
ncbi:bifunctional metallophosphatase/5'-nucleotidase [Peptoniphilus sp. AGMB00490]|uniref:Bifunctional metallophosphatase/5'-nucleotidase n=1 Tax=Peptoniphilus faecalis TaxID=2731255 RepID=A0A848REI8_9FIRM|nr:bifunctional UDP-sugar hydrolase/5'-nucleotidase [Peptoniphilus faecalis]NMW85250.1 bifunctional metallophosphatase/5'-nucleotidase [Peptoniphilus faecalis]